VPDAFFDDPKDVSVPCALACLGSPCQLPHALQVPWRSFSQLKASKATEQPETLPISCAPQISGYTAIIPEPDCMFYELIKKKSKRKQYSNDEAGLAALEADFASLAANALRYNTTVLRYAQQCGEAGRRRGSSNGGAGAAGGAVTEGAEERLGEALMQLLSEALGQMADEDLQPHREALKGAETLRDKAPAVFADQRRELLKNVKGLPHTNMFEPLLPPSLKQGTASGSAAGAGPDADARAS
jgi:hypothetical protein